MGADHVLQESWLSYFECLAAQGLVFEVAIPREAATRSLELSLIHDFK